MLLYWEKISWRHMVILTVRLLLWDLTTKWTRLSSMTLLPNAQCCEGGRWFPWLIASTMWRKVPHHCPEPPIEEKNVPLCRKPICPNGCWWDNKPHNAPRPVVQKIHGLVISTYKHNLTHLTERLILLYFQDNRRSERRAFCRTNGLLVRRSVLSDCRGIWNNGCSPVEKMKEN